MLFELANPTDIHLNLTVLRKPEQTFYRSEKDLPGEPSVDVHCHFEKYDKKPIPGIEVVQLPHVLNVKPIFTIKFNKND